ncbi:uncharacterized protein [Watersipora subatra]|uniref:uncharacterized protein n=1 Tax=Watersipora subatra TaxID=2589382 RepID=UPI00355C9D80
MLVQVTALEETAEEDIDKSSADSFFDTLELIWQGVCAGIVSGQEPQIGKSSLLTFRAHLTAFDSLANASMTVSCADCEEVATPANFTLGNHIANSYGEWNCTDGETCYGGCLATGQLNYDILTASSDAIEPYVSARLSDIVAIHLINPSTFAFTTVSNLTSPIQFTIQLTSTPQTASYEYMCRGWDSQLNDWSDRFCLAASLDNSTGAWTAVCSCYSTGYFAVFEGAEIIDAALYATTESFVVFEETTTAANYLNGLDEGDLRSVSISFRIDADHALLQTHYESVEAGVLLWLNDVMNVSESRLINLLLTQGSIKVEFELLPGGSGQTGINSAIKNLETRVLAGALIPIGGTSYSCIAEPLVIEVNEKELSENSSPILISPGLPLGPGLIIGIAIGCSLLTILIVVIVAAVIIKKNNANNKVQHSPRSSEAQLPIVDDYELKKTKVSPDEEALYGPAPVAHQAQPVTSDRMGSTVLPIGSRPSSTKKETSMTPVDSALQ